MALEIENLTGVGLIKKVNGKAYVVLDRATASDGTISETTKQEIIEEVKESLTDDFLTKDEADGAYLPITGGTLTGATYAPTPDVTDSSTRLATTAHINNKITYGSTDLTSGSSPLTTGVFYFVYE